MFFLSDILWCRPMQTPARHHRGALLSSVLIGWSGSLSDYSQHGLTRFIFRHDPRLVPAQLGTRVETRCQYFGWLDQRLLSFNASWKNLQLISWKGTSELEGVWSSTEPKPSCGVTEKMSMYVFQVCVPLKILKFAYNYRLTKAASFYLNSKTSC